MNQGLSSLLAGTFLLLPLACALAAPSVQVAGLTGRTQPYISNLPAVFGNKEQGIDLEIDGAAALTGSLRADLFQASGTLAMPLTKDLTLQDSLTLTGAPTQHVPVTIKFPGVKKQAEILLRLSLVPKGPDAKATPLGEIRFAVFPSSLTKDLTDLLQPKPDGPVPVVVFGPGQNLRHFLADLKISFEDGGTNTPDRFDPARLYFGELTTNDQFLQAQDRGAGAHLALFSPDESVPAGVYTERSSAGVLIHVTSPLLDNLANDPRAQSGFVKIIHLLSAPPPSAN